jgi:hypothetical protein
VGDGILGKDITDEYFKIQDSSDEHEEDDED